MGCSIETMRHECEPWDIRRAYGRTKHKYADIVVSLTGYAVRPPFVSASEASSYNKCSIFYIMWSSGGVKLCFCLSARGKTGIV